MRVRFAQRFRCFRFFASRFLNMPAASVLAMAAGADSSGTRILRSEQGRLPFRKLQRFIALSPRRLPSSSWPMSTSAVYPAKRRRKVLPAEEYTDFRVAISPNRSP